jgi:hypothetical protein
MVGQITIKEEWNRYASTVHSKVQVGSNQYKQLELCWYSAYFISLAVMKNKIAALNEDDAVKSLEGLNNEAEAFLTAEYERAVKTVGCDA